MSAKFSLILLLALLEKIVTNDQINSCEVSYISKELSPIYFCEIPNQSETGTCKELHKCDDATERPDHYRTLHVCEYTKSSKIHKICCSNREPIAPGSRSRISCRNYFFKELLLTGEEVPAHGDLEAAKAKPLEFPHMAAVGFGVKPDIKWLCGGTIIHPRYVLTAGHCTINQNRPPTWVRVGDLNLDLPNEVNGTRDVRITKIYRHPNYRYPSFYHDIALLKLETFLDLYNFLSIQPACLHTNEPAALWAEHLQSIGWGATEFQGQRSSHLLKVNMSVVDYDECRERYSKSRRIRDGVNSDYQICAGNEFGGDSCQGDSGGPLHFDNYTAHPDDFGKVVLPHYVVVGITSFGNGCGGGQTAGVYTKVQPYLKWIEDIIWPICNTTEEVIFWK